MHVHCSLGTDCSLQPYQILIQLPILWSLIILIAGLAVESYRNELRAMPMWLAVIMLIAMLSITPIGLALQLYAHMLVWSIAPLGQSVIVTSFGLYAVGILTYFLVGPTNWAKINQR